MVLIISSKTDPHAASVIEEIKKTDHNFYLWDLSAYPEKQMLSISYKDADPQITLQEESGEIIDFSKFTSAWWRRPQHFTISPDIKDSINLQFSYGECQAAFNGLVKLLPVRWMNPPVVDEAASRKAYQLQVAKSVGLKIPGTLITNDPEKAKLFIRDNQDMEVIYKSFSAIEQAWRETRLIKEEEMEKLENVKYTPVIFQEYIRSVADLRITVVGDEIFPAAIYIPPSSYQVDFRMTYGSSKIVRHELPQEIQKKLLALMKSLGIVYGAIDMRLTPEGEYIFLEVNTAGQWLFMEEPTELPISKAIADWLTKGEPIIQSHRLEKKLETAELY
jgi:glutathione synthase/RimK-type ligase-like ATP-grasp enzyme